MGGRQSRDLGRGLERSGQIVPPRSLIVPSRAPTPPLRMSPPLLLPPTQSPPASAYVFSSAIHCTLWPRCCTACGEQCIFLNFDSGTSTDRYSICHTSAVPPATEFTSHRYGLGVAQAPISDPGITTLERLEADKFSEKIMEVQTAMCAPYTTRNPIKDDPKLPGQRSKRRCQSKTAHYLATITAACTSGPNKPSPRARANRRRCSTLGIARKEHRFHLHLLLQVTLIR